MNRSMSNVQARQHVPLLDLEPELDRHADEFLEAMERVMRSGRFILGLEVEAFEEETADYLGVERAVGVNSGTDALVIALGALGVEEGDEVITTSFTFFATAESIEMVGATPVFADIDPDSLNLDPTRVETAARYGELLAEVPGGALPDVTEGHVFHQYTIRVAGGRRDDLRGALDDRGISTAVYYPVPCHRLPVYADRDFRELPETERAAGEVISLPIWLQLDAETQSAVADAIRETLAG